MKGELGTGGSVILKIRNYITCIIDPKKNSRVIPPLRERLPVVRGLPRLRDAEHRRLVVPLSDDLHPDGKLDFLVSQGGQEPDGEGKGWVTGLRLGFSCTGLNVAKGKKGGRTRLNGLVLTVRPWLLEKSSRTVEVGDARVFVTQGTVGKMRTSNLDCAAS